MCVSGMAAPMLSLFMILTIVSSVGSGAEATWCVARSEASEQVLQRALDYACGSGADCAPIQPDGLCYLPNTILAHASYAFNSFYQRKDMAPGSCDFSGTATVAKTDPSYGSCVYPSSPSTAGGSVPPRGGTSGTASTTPPYLYPPPLPPLGTTPLTPNNNGVGPEVSGPPNSSASTETLISFSLYFALVCLASLLGCGVI